MIKNVVLINGSPKVNSSESVSEQFIKLQEGFFATSDTQIYRTNARTSLNKGKTEEDFEAMLNADAIIFTFPLYIFCLPGLLMRYLQDFEQYWREKKGFLKPVKIYAVVNCGFPEAYINEEAVRVIQSFSRHTNAKFRFGIMVGAGGMMLGAIDAPFMKKTKAELDQAFHQIAEDIMSDTEQQPDTITVKVNINPKLYYFMGNRGWFYSARKNNLKKKDLYRKPYLQ